MVTQGIELPVSPAELLSRCSRQPFVFLLDGGGEASWGTGRALLGFRPRATLQVTAHGDAVLRDGGREERWHGDPFTSLERFCARWMPPHRRQGEPLSGGVIAALSYDLKQWVERLPARARDAVGLPVLHAAFYDWLLSYSYTKRRYQLASAGCSREALADVAAHIDALAGAPGPAACRATRACAVPDWSKEAYERAVRAVLDYVAAGDAYQINLAQRFVVPHPPAPARLFAALQQAHPVPFGAYVDGGDFVLVSNSPECFLTLRDGRVTTSPIKGTRRRGSDARRDAALVAELLADPKERAEHVMIVDLERSDLGRVCRTGSVRVAEFARVQTFPSLHHIVSTVTGRLRPEVSLAGVLRATFPGGSITGAPKIRAMEIIDELEPVTRGFYTGAIGFVGPGGNAVFNLAIRTAVATSGTLTYHAGGGIVADSDPTREYDETLLKAQPFFAALGAATI